MKTIYLIAGTLFLFRSISIGQLQFPRQEVKWQELPARAEPGETPPAQTSVKLVSGGGAAEAALFDRIEREHLLKPEVPVYDNELERKMAAAFEPKIIHLRHGQTRIYSSVVTAIARNNPFCLLDPCFLQITF